MMIFSLVAMIGLEKCCITSACLQWLCHSGERIVARGPLVLGLSCAGSNIFTFSNRKKGGICRVGNLDVDFQQVTLVQFF